ncbi:hypothetical protein [Brachybacterium sacelli]|uniref:DUF998 domain-containing protein n=1 Tax=Brachybacterium sacelli TaxID=173364 RepID=A0ABS4WYT1_9MICO|nr:hypothetical protein [Brachybacterium sacelli]MBP2381303.1 hypothetical protein [Brachybacterium sacelli]
MHPQQPSHGQRRIHGCRGRRRSGRAAQVVGLLALCGIGAELLLAYDETTGDPIAIAVALVIFGALYGAPALLVRELSRRAGWGWPSMLLQFAALGVVQACLIDQSLFAADYGGYEGWAESREPTLIPALGFSGYNAFTFLIGHLLFSFAAPVALAEAWAPQRARTPWLGPLGTVLAGVAYLAAAALIVTDPQSWSASMPQLVGAVGVVVVLVGTAALVGRRGRGEASERPSRRGEIPLWAVVLPALVAAAAPDFVPPTWPGVAGAVAITAGFGVLLLLSVRRRRWGISQTAAVGLGFLLARGLMAFTYFPLIGDVSAAAKYAHSAVMLLAVLVAGALALSPRAGVRSSLP